MTHSNGKPERAQLIFHPGAKRVANADPTKEPTQTPAMIAVYPPGSLTQPDLNVAAYLIEETKGGRFECRHRTGPAHPSAKTSRPLKFQTFAFGETYRDAQKACGEHLEKILDSLP